MKKKYETVEVVWFKDMAGKDIIIPVNDFLMPEVIDNGETRTLHLFQFKTIENITTSKEEMIRQLLDGREDNPLINWKGLKNNEVT